MLTLGLFARLEAKPDKADEVAAFLMQGLQLANQEKTTPVWFALRLGPTLAWTLSTLANTGSDLAWLAAGLVVAVLASR